MVDWDNASGVADSDAYELALLISLLPQSVNLCTAYNIWQRRYDYRLRLLRLGLWLGLRFGLCLSLRLPLWLLRCTGLCVCRLLIFSASLEFLFKILTAEIRIKFLVPELVLADSIIKIDTPGLPDFLSYGYAIPSQEVNV